MEQFRGGRTAALSQLYLRYRVQLLRFCFRLLSDSQAAEDTVQNVFLKLQTEQSSIRNTGSLKSWLFMVARNEAIGELRKKHGEELDEETMWIGAMPDDVLAAKDRKEKINSVLNSLYPSFREVIILREYELLSYEEIATVTGTTVSSVKSRIFKARKALIEKLQPYLEDYA